MPSPTRAYGNTVERIAYTLRDQGPMTLSELCDELGQARGDVSAVVTRMRRDLKTMPKRVYVSHYVYDMEGERRYPRAVYALGGQKDASKPKPNRKEVRRRSDAKRRIINTTNSVFNLAVPRREYRI